MPRSRQTAVPSSQNVPAFKNQKKLARSSTVSKTQSSSSKTQSSSSKSPEFFKGTLKLGQLLRQIKGPLPSNLSVSGNYVTQEMRNIGKLAEEILKRAVSIQVSKRRKTLSQEFIVLALQELGYDVFIPPNAKDFQRIKTRSEKEIKDRFMEVWGQVQRSGTSQSNTKSIHIQRA